MSIRTSVEQYLAKRLFGYGPTDNWSYVDQFQGPAKDVKLLGMYAGVTYRCINTIAEAMGDKYIPYLYTKNTQGKKTTIPTHPLLDLLANPNPDMSYYQLIEGSTTFLEQFGEFFWYMVPGSLSGYANGVKQIYLLRPDKMGITLDKDTGEVLGYNYTTGTGQEKIPFEAEEIVHHMNFNPKNPYRGYSTVEAAIDYIQTEMEVSRFTRNYFRNNAAMSGVLNVSGKVPRENWNKFVRQWRERYAGVDNAGKVALVRDSQITFTPIASSISDMQLTELKQTTVDQILMMFRIPKGLFGMESDQGLGRASVETLEYIFSKWTLDNKMGRYDDVMEMCLRRYYPQDKYLVDHENIIPADKAFELQVYDKGVDRWLTRNEIREKDPDLQNNDIDGADQLFVATTMLPIDDVMSSDQAASKPPVVNPPSKNDTEDSNDDGDGTDGKTLKLKLSKKKESPEEFRQALAKVASEHVPDYIRAFHKVLDKQETTVKENIKHLGRSLSDNLFNQSDEDQNFQEEVSPILMAIVAEAGQIAVQYSNADGSYSFSQSVENAIRKSTQKMSQNFDAQTLQELQDTLTEGVTAGEGYKQLSTRVSEVYDEAKSYRTERVARTESQNASNSATLDAYQQNPVVKAMQWFANPSACQYCGELDGTVVGLDASFVAEGDSVDVTDDNGDTSSYQADYGSIDTPPLHPNCECTIIPVTE